MPRPRFFLALLLLLAPLALAVEIPVSAVRIGRNPSTWSRTNVAIADGAATSFVTWTTSFSPMASSGVMARVIDATGVRMHSAEVFVGGGTWAQAAWNGRDYFVVMTPSFSRFGATTDLPTIVGVQVSVQGTVIEQTRVTLRRGRRGAFVSGIAWNGESYLIVARQDDQSLLLLVDANGAVVREQVVPFNLIAVDRRGDAFVIAGASNGTVALYDVDRRGDIGAATPLSGPISGGTVIEAARGNEIAAVSVRTEGLVATIINESGTTDLRITGPDVPEVRSVAWDGSAYRVAWRTNVTSDSPPPCLTRFTDRGVLGTTCASEAFRGWMAPATGARIVAWPTTATPQMIVGGRDIKDPLVLSETAPAQISPAMVPAGDGYLTAWSELSADSGLFEIRVARIHADGTREADRVIAADDEHHAESVRLARAGDRVLAVWYERFDGIYALRLDLTGAPIGDKIRLGDGSAPQVASDGSEWMVVWEDDTEVTAQTRATAVTASGEVVDLGTGPGGTIVVPNDAWQRQPQVAWNGERWVITYLEAEVQAGQGTHERVIVQLVDRFASRVIAPVTLTDITYSYSSSNPVPQHVTLARAACASEQCLVTWVNDFTLQAALVSRDGVPAEVASPPQSLLNTTSTRLFAMPGNTYLLTANVNGVVAALTIDASGHVIAQRTLAGPGIGLGDLVPRDGDVAFIHSRITTPNEELGGVSRVFVRFGGERRARVVMK